MSGSSPSAPGATPDTRHLDELHAEFARAISDETPVPDAPRAATFAVGAGTAGPRLSAEQQLEIYREQFWLRHHGALAEDYPALERFLGPELFARAAALHVESGGLEEENLTWFGRDFERAVMRLPVESASVRVAVELARLEWLEVESFHAATAPPLEPGTITALAPADFLTLRFVFAPAMRLARFEHPVVELRRRLRDEDAEAEVAASGRATCADSDRGPRVEERATFVVLSRPKWRVLAHEASEPEFLLLEALAAGMSLVEAVEAVSAKVGHDSFTSELSSWFEAWGRRWLIAGVERAPAGA